MRHATIWGMQDPGLVNHYDELRPGPLERRLLDDFRKLSSDELAALLNSLRLGPSLPVSDESRPDARRVQ